MDLADINQLFDYTEWANDKALSAAERLTESSLYHDFGISHKSIFETLLHMAGAEWIWFERWNGRSPAKDVAWSMWTPHSCPDIAALRARWSDVVQQRRNYLSHLPESELAAEVPFKLLSGDASSLKLRDQMQHVINHSTLHRGQVVGMVRQLGFEPPSTDLLFYLRTDVSPK
ncbi:MAG: DinB family protein [Pyrinomonadaceae bacterium]